jgi:hypothetical protein
LHLDEEVCVDIHAIGKDEPLVANADDVAEAFWGQVGQRHRQQDAAPLPDGLFSWMDLPT